jgi:hypothetical protein
LNIMDRVPRGIPHDTLWIIGLRSHLVMPLNFHTDLFVSTTLCVLYGLLQVTYTAMETLHFDGSTIQKAWHW